MCLAQGPQYSDTGEARTCGPSVLSQALHHCATVLTNEELEMNIGIVHVFSYINICLVLRKLFEQEADSNETNMCDRYSCILPYSSQIRPENAAKTLKHPFSFSGFLSTKWRQL